MNYDIAGLTLSYKDTINELILKLVVAIAFNKGLTKLLATCDQLTNCWYILLRKMVKVTYLTATLGKITSR